VSDSTKNDEQKRWQRWLYAANVGARLIVASLVFIWVVIPLVDVATASLKLERVERAIALTEVADQRIAATNAQAGLQQAPSPAPGIAPASAETTTVIKKRTDAIPRVWAFAIQVAGLVGLLGMALWAMVAILKRE